MSNHIKEDEVAKGVYVELVEGFEPRSLLDTHYLQADSIFIRENHLYNDSTGPYVWVSSEDVGVSQVFYLKDLKLKYPYNKSF